MLDKHQIDKDFFRTILVGQIGGILLLLAGVILVVLGVTGLVEVKVSLGPIDGWLKDASPGLVLSLFGIVLLAYYKPKKRASIQEIEDKSDTTFRSDELRMIIQILLKEALLTEGAQGENKQTTEQLSAQMAEVIENYMKARYLYGRYNVPDKSTSKTRREVFIELESRFPELDIQSQKGNEPELSNDS